MDIGSRLKELRILKGLTQEELADRAELSKGFISQVERNLTSPSIATLMDILQCLGTSVSEFFSETAEDQVVFGQQDYFKKLDGELLNEIQWIIPNAQKNRMEPILLTLKAGGSTCPDNPHEGEEFGYVLSGSVVIHLGSRSFRASRFISPPTRPTISPAKREPSFCGSARRPASEFHSPAHAGSTQEDLNDGTPTDRSGKYFQDL